MPELNTLLCEMDIVLKRLTDVLYAEQEILLENGAIHRLSEIIDAKNKLLINLKLLDENREKLDKKNNFSPPYNNEKSLMTSWEAIVAMTKELSQINHDNGLILQKKMASTQESIQFLTSFNKNELYTNVGYKQTSPMSIKRAEA